VIQDFINNVIKTFRKGSATEHSYRPALQELFDSLDPAVTALNEPRREKVGAPDFSISRGDIIIGHCEAKDLPVDLKVMKDANFAQKKRYVGGLQNLLYTNCLEWLWYRDGELKHEVRIGDFLMGVQPIPERYAALEALLREFISQTPQTITSSRALAERMAGKALLIKDILANSLMQDKDGSTELSDQYHAFKEHLIHDISIAEFADIYAETITYGMFAARLHDTSLGNFNRQEALELLPKSNPFLRNLFSYIAGPNLDPRIVWIIDDLARLFRASDVSALMEKYGKTTQRNDPFLHFYEDFLKAYNPQKRDARGVWYTPEPIVNFIVRAVDDVLKNEFGLSDGLADTSKVTIDWDTGQRGITKSGKIAKSNETVKVKKEVHRVQILDPATGTGTFLAEVIKQVAPRVKNRAPALWAGYVEKDLIPRLHGFELLMASYAMCHMKLDMVLREYGYQPTASPPRVSVYLTNSLEEGEAANQTLPFAQWLSNEVKAANAIKRDMPIMVVIGNPPYRGESVNRGAWIMGLMEAYKKEPGGRKKLEERNPKWINDDYVKFIRMAEALIEKNGQGVLGFITNHGYLDNPTFRGMRWHLLKTFNKIYVLDLHGNAKKKEVAPDGSPDKNVFDIQQGVSIVLAVKLNRSPDELAQVMHRDLWGDRKQKYDDLWQSTLRATTWKEITPKPLSYPLVPRNWRVLELYEAGLRVSDLMPVHSIGVVTGDDSRFIMSSREALKDEWRLERSFSDSKIQRVSYRPFDEAWLMYAPDNLERARWNVMRHYVGRPNIGLLATKAMRDRNFHHVFATAFINEAIFLSGTTASNAMNFPLYLYPEPTELDQVRRVNFEPALYAKLRKLASHPKKGEPDEVTVFDYIYGVLHCPAYRETYAEFLKIDFPRIPWPPNPDVFWDVSDKGGQLRRLHLMEPSAVGETSYPFVGDERQGRSEVGKPEFRNGAVWINKHQRFESTPEVSWNFYVGGYQPAQKWLKDRKGRTIDYAEVQHYQRILKILAETDRIMATIQMPID
jgi:predicted helicase